MSSRSCFYSADQSSTRVSVGAGVGAGAGLTASWSLFSITSRFISKGVNSLLHGEPGFRTAVFPFIALKRRVVLIFMQLKDLRSGVARTDKRKGDEKSGNTCWPI